MCSLALSMHFSYLQTCPQIWSSNFAILALSLETQKTKCEKCEKFQAKNTKTSTKIACTEN